MEKGIIYPDQMSRILWWQWEKIKEMYAEIVERSVKDLSRYQFEE